MLKNAISILNYTQNKLNDKNFTLFGVNRSIKAFLESSIKHNWKINHIVESMSLLN